MTLRLSAAGKLPFQSYLHKFGHYSLLSLGIMVMVMMMMILVMILIPMTIMATRRLLIVQ